MNNKLIIKNLEVSIEEKKILNSINLNIQPGEIHAIMGPNGSGKSSFANTIMGNPKFKITNGKIIFNETELNTLPPDKRAKLGIFLAFQNPFEFEGVSLFDFLWQTYSLINKDSKKTDLFTFKNLISKKCALLKINETFLNRFLNFGFSGGEKKLAEVLQISILNPKLIILDEIDSGLDIDALKNVCEHLLFLKKENPLMSIIIITHYPRILNYLRPNFVHILQDGVIAKSGDYDLALEIEKEGYQK